MGELIGCIIVTGTWVALTVLPNMVVETIIGLHSTNAFYAFLVSFAWILVLIVSNLMFLTSYFRSKLDVHTKS